MDTLTEHEGGEAEQRPSGPTRKSQEVFKEGNTEDISSWDSE